MKMSIWIKIKQQITSWLWGDNGWFRLADRMDEIRKDINVDRYFTGEFVWDCSPWNGGRYKVTIKKL